MKKIKTLVTYLEMCAQRPTQSINLPDGMQLQLKENIKIEHYREIYNAIGQQYFWVSREKLSDEELGKIIHHPNVKIYFLYDDNKPIGFFEINSKNHPRSVEISFIGLVNSAIGHGLGKILTQLAIKQAWSHKAGRIIIQTCTLDHKHALPLYQKLGFKAYNRHTAEITLSD
ncbi:MAG: GNAT family N-acetyltransferase [Rhizobiales bacterium]|nr:GNAT family N-acetyltransferase [Hyphomicrobiales bacterium]